jgi:TusA-related sulfurtransferase
MDKLQKGQILKVLASDPVAPQNIDAWAKACAILPDIKELTRNIGKVFQSKYGKVMSMYQ